MKSISCWSAFCVLLNFQLLFEFLWFCLSKINLSQRNESVWKWYLPSLLHSFSQMFSYWSVLKARVIKGSLKSNSFNYILKAKGIGQWSTQIEKTLAVQEPFRSFQLILYLVYLYIYIYIYIYCGCNDICVIDHILWSKIFTCCKFYHLLPIIWTLCYVIREILLQSTAAQND